MYEENDKNTVAVMTRKVDMIKEFHINVSDTGVSKVFVFSLFHIHPCICFLISAPAISSPASPLPHPTQLQRNLTNTLLNFHLDFDLI